MHPKPLPLCVLLTAPALAQPFTEDFESADVGSFPPSPWRDIASSVIPAPPTPTGEVIETVGLAGTTTRAFQVYQLSSASQGIIADIGVSAKHRVEADLRVDHHPSPVNFGDWTAAMGFFNQRSPADINAEPQGVVYVYNSRWYFYGALTPGNAVNIELASVPVVAGDWYHVALDADTTSGTFTVTVRDDVGDQLLNRTVTLFNPSPDLLAFNRVAIFDGEYSGRPATAGQFTADNIAYLPSPAVPAAFVVIALRALRRR